MRYTSTARNRPRSPLTVAIICSFSLGENTTVHAAIFAAGKRVGDVVTSEFVRLPLTIGRASGAFRAPCRGHWTLGQAVRVVRFSRTLRAGIVAAAGPAAPSATRHNKLTDLRLVVQASRLQFQAGGTPDRKTGVKLF